MSQSVEQKKAEVLQFDPGKPEPLPFEFFNNRTRNYTKLVNNTDEGNFMQGRNHAYWYELKEPVYLNQIDVEVEGYSGYQKLEFRWRTQRDTTVQSDKTKIDDDTFTVVINDVVSAFCIEPPKQYFSDPKLKSVTVYGNTLDELDNVMEEFGDLDRKVVELKEECNEWVDKANEAEASITTLDARKTAINTEIENFTGALEIATDAAEAAQSDLDEVEKTLIAKRSEESDLVSRVEKIEDGIDQKKKDTQALNTEITERKRELKELKDDVNLFPTEISGYVKQGSKNIRHYSLLAFVPMVVLVLFVGVLFSNAVNLSTIYQRLEGMDLWTMFFSRMPFAVIAIFIIHACYKIAKMFILEVVRISNRRLDLTKVSIVAKDVSDTSARDLDFTDDEIYELNTKLKMEMLKSHLKGYVADDYEHDIDISLWDRFKRALAKKQPPEEAPD